MPKTKDAFALADFDAERILQRPFFKTLCLPMTIDKEIIADYDPLDIVANIPAKLRRLQELQDFLAAYTKKLLSHELKLEKIILRYSELYVQTNAQIYKEKYSRAYILQQSYLIANEFNGRLQRSVIYLGSVAEDVLDGEYRTGFGIRLRNARRTKGLTQLELARRVGFKSYNSIAQYERGINEPSASVVFKLAKELECSADWLLGLK